MKPLLLITLFIFLTLFTAYPRQEKHTVEVPIIKVLVRVFDKGKPVGNLKKEDFILSVNKTQKAIHVFYPVVQDLKVPVGDVSDGSAQIDPVRDGSARTPGTSARTPGPGLFLLIFNVCDAQLDAQKLLDYLFSRIIRRRDRLMVITNRDFIDDHTVYNLKGEQETILEILESEKQYVKKKTDAFKLRMKSILRRFKAGMKYALFQEQKREDFILEFRQLVRRYKSLLLTMTEERYFQLAEYLKDQSCEKWVLNFYQKGKFYKPKLNSEFNSDLLGPKFMDSHIRYLELQEIFETDGKIEPKELSQLFAGTGAVFHTLLMENRSAVQNNLSPDLSFASVGSDAYDLLKKIAKRTGGTFMNTRDPAKFFKKVSAYQDISYVIGYHPGNDEIGKLKITHKNKKYKLVWD